MGDEPRLIVACVNVGQHPQEDGKAWSSKYGWHYVERLRRGVQRHLAIPHRFVCLTNNPTTSLYRVKMEDVDQLGLRGWWAKMALFRPNWRGDLPVLYLDLDTVVNGDITVLGEAVCSLTTEQPFAVTGSFTRAAGNDNWPCKYGSAVMGFAPHWGKDVWDGFRKRLHFFLREYHKYGDQKAIQDLYPDALLLQEHMPERFFAHWRNLQEPWAAEAKLVIFGGSHKPDNCELEWVQEAWKRKGK